MCKILTALLGKERGEVVDGEQRCLGLVDSFLRNLPDRAFGINREGVVRVVGVAANIGDDVGLVAFLKLAGGDKRRHRFRNQDAIDDDILFV